MKKFMFLLMSFLFMGNSVFAESSPKEISTSTQSSSLVKKALYVTVGAGAVVSGVMWAQPTYLAIALHGVLGAIYTTHIPRIVLDVATVAACYNAYSDESNKEEQK